MPQVAGKPTELTVSFHYRVPNIKKKERGILTRHSSKETRWGSTSDILHIHIQSFKIKHMEFISNAKAWWRKQKNDIILHKISLCCKISVGN